jgi:hypothetical protein
MGALKNTRRELFAQALSRGLCACAAQEAAGYEINRGNAARLKATESVSQRIAELQAQTAKSNEITIQSICVELDQAAAIAREKGQGQALVSVASLRAKLGGLLQDRVLVETSNGPTLDDESSAADVAAAMAKERGVNLSPDDLKAFMGVIEGWHEAMQEFLASCRAKQIDGVPVHSERKRLGLTGHRSN